MCEEVYMNKQITGNHFETGDRTTKDKGPITDFLQMLSKMIEVLN